MEACKERKVDRTKHFISMKQVKFQVEEEEGQSTSLDMAHKINGCTRAFRLLLVGLLESSNAPPKAKVTQNKLHKGDPSEKNGLPLLIVVRIRPLSVGIRLWVREY